jgi:DDE superfamily endonuclease
VDSVHDHGRSAALGELVGFRREFYASLTARADALFELTDAVLCTDGPVTSLPELSLTATHRRGHGALYDGLARGAVDVGRLRWALAGLELPRGADGGLRFAVDVTPWPRPDAECSPDRLHCHRNCRCDGTRKTIPGWPYSVIAALESGRSSWTAPVDLLRLGPDDDLTEITAAQVRDLIGRLIEAGQYSPGDPPVLIVLDSGYDLPRLSWLLSDLPVQLLGRIRSNRVFYGPPGPRRGQRPGRQPRHGHKFVVADAATHPQPELETASTHDRFGTVRARAWSRLHPDLERRGAWTDHPGPLPIVEATIIGLAVDHLPGNRQPKPLWLWSSHPVTSPVDLDRLWRTYLRRFDLEHTFRFFKQTLGFTRPRLRLPAQADRWAWLILTAYTQLRLARGLTDDLRHPWENKTPEARTLTPGRTRRGFRRVRRAAGNPASAPKAPHPGPGRPKGRTSTPAPRYPVGKNNHKTDKPRRRTSKQAT